MNVFALREGIFTINAQHQVAKYDNTNHVQGGLVVGIQPFVIQTEQENILFDTGLGWLNENGLPTLYDCLAEYQLMPEDITTVIISHLHHDHVKGITHTTRNTNQQALSFPQAKYYIHQSDFEEKIHSANTDEDIKKKLLFLQNETSALIFYSGDEGMIYPHIRFLKTNAHCKHHCVFWIEDNNETIFYGADDAPQLFQMQQKITTKYDAQPTIAKDLRAKWWEQGTQEKWTFLFYHDTSTPIYRPQ